MSTSTLREYEQALQTDPTLTEPFLALRKAYGESKTWDKLITLYELRAQALDEGPKASELFYLAGEIRLDHMDDPEGAEADLAHAIDRDPENLKAAQRLKHLYRQQARLSEYMAMLEVEAAALARSRDATRIADLDRELGQFCKESLGQAGAGGDAVDLAAPGGGDARGAQAGGVGAQDLPGAGRFPRGGAAVRAGAGPHRRGQAAQRPAAGAGAGAGRAARRSGGGGPAPGRGGAAAAPGRSGAGGAGRGVRQPGLAGRRRQGAGGDHLPPDRPPAPRGGGPGERGLGPPQGPGRGARTPPDLRADRTGPLRGGPLRRPRSLLPGADGGGARPGREDGLSLQAGPARRGRSQRSRRGPAHLPGDRRDGAAGGPRLAAAGRALHREAGLGPAGRAPGKAASPHRGARVPPHHPDRAGPALRRAAG